MKPAVYVLIILSQPAANKKLIWRFLENNRKYVQHVYACYLVRCLALLHPFNFWWICYWRYALMVNNVCVLSDNEPVIGIRTVVFRHIRTNYIRRINNKFEYTRRTKSTPVDGQPLQSGLRHLYVGLCGCTH